MQMSEYVVELKNATKRFPGVVALKNMQLSVKPGEILGLIGENGAGKSTLIKVLTGVHQADEGQIFVDGVEQHFKDPNDSAAAGIACVYQELNIEIPPSPLSKSFSYLILYLENCILENINIFITQKIQDIRDKNQECL